MNLILCNITSNSKDSDRSFDHITMICDNRAKKNNSCIKKEQLRGNYVTFMKIFENKIHWKKSKFSFKS